MLVYAASPFLSERTRLHRHPHTVHASASPQLDRTVVARRAQGVIALHGGAEQRSSITPAHRRLMTCSAIWPVAASRRASPQLPGVLQRHVRAPCLVCCHINRRLQRANRAITVAPHRPDHTMHCLPWTGTHEVVCAVLLSHSEPLIAHPQPPHLPLSLRTAPRQSGVHAQHAARCAIR